MEYTLFIDESGDFETHKGEWIIGGALFEGNYNSVESKLKNLRFPDGFTPQNRAEFHLTEFRKIYSSEETIDKVKTLYKSVSKTNCKFYLIGVTNDSKLALSQRERTYRVMLKDLLIIIDNSIPNIETIDNLDLIVASRTINGIAQTTVENIQKDILDFIPKDMEYDLSTMFFVQMIRKNKVNVKIAQANSNWGLICADFLCNVLYHHNAKYESLFIRDLKNQKRLFTFNALGNFEERRARIAERNNDLVLAISRWLRIAFKAKDPTQYFNEINDLLLKIINDKTTSKGKYSLLALIERVWRMYDDKTSKGRLLEILDNAISSNIEEYSELIPSIIFKLRNLRLLISDQLGNTSEALKIDEKQQKNLQALRNDPENLGIVADYYRIRIEIYLNELDFKKSYELANKYNDFTENVIQLWSLIDEDSKTSSQSQFSIKKNSTVTRLLAFTSQYIDRFDEGNFFKQNDELLNYCKDENDKSRIYNNIIVYLLRNNKANQAYSFLKKWDISPRSCTNYELYQILQTLCSLILNEENIENKQIEEIKNRLDSDNNLSNVGHPNEVIFAEAALLFKLLNDNKTSGRYIHKAQVLSLDEQSKILRLINAKIKIYYSFIFEKQFNSKCLEEFITKQKDTLKDILIQIRNLSIGF